MWVLGFVISQQVMFYIFQRENRPRKDVDTLTMYILISTVLGARLGHFLFDDPSRFLTDPLDILMPPLRQRLAPPRNYTRHFIASPRSAYCSTSEKPALPASAMGL